MSRDSEDKVDDSAFIQSIDDHLKDIISMLNETPNREDGEDVYYSEEVGKLVGKIENMDCMDADYEKCIEDLVAADKRSDRKFKKETAESYERISKMLDDMNEYLSIS